MAAFVQVNTYRYVGLSTDTKPTGAAAGAEAHELDTGATYFTADGTNWLWKAGGHYSPSGVFTPANTSHAAGDCVGGVVEFTNAGPPNGLVSIRTARIKINNASAEATGWVLKAHNATPAAQVDDASWSFLDADRATLKASIYLGNTSVDQGANQFDSTSPAVEVRCSPTGSLFCQLVCDTTVTTGAVAHTVELETLAL